MKNVKYGIAILASVSLILFSCNKDDEITNQENSSLTFSQSPIELNGIDAKFSKDNSYGSYPENKFDIFIPASSTPTPLVIYIHGGGFLGGEKEKPYTEMPSGQWVYASEIRTFLSNKIAFASVNYRLLALEGDKEGVLKSLNDSKLALQYIRSISKVLNIDKNNIVLCGSSAGGGTSLWLAFSDDMADPSNSDPVLRESTRVKGLAVKPTQATYNFGRYATDVFKEYDFTWQWYFQQDPSMIPRFNSFYGMSDTTQFNSPSIIDYRAKVDMLAMMSADDPEFWADNPQVPVVEPTQVNILNHHSFHARTLKQWGDSIGIPNVVSYGYHQDPSGESFMDFIIRKTEE
ncbi:alpha/beta hydrolase fold domain-containing protein [Aequorivita todarodis]|uniref:alpha/beta hydrolase fold domain-containing protein n=1 Tax=Aequorivita todarodis TaxID=2036821 RepID=UPI00234FF18A|nr:alpha/beta hydrolase fold domain-containing protein [Aequorivita todarodis]MDC8001480.1 alpha/beta hydrolase fold domain-containing protein [Aequorivita todarodis]